MKIKEFHDVMSVDDARKVFFDSVSCSASVDDVDIADALGRVLACDVFSPIDVPGFSRSQRDGYAVAASDTFAADEERPVRLKVSSDVISAGDDSSCAVSTGSAVRIATGAPMPRGANAVVMVEYCTEVDGFVDVFSSVHPGEHVMHAGQDIMQGETVLFSGTRIGFRETGVLAALGVSKVAVYSRPRVAVISTGNEIVGCGDELGPGKIYDVNARMIADACRENGAECDILGIARDDEDEVSLLLKKGLSYDFVILSGGTSAGAGDVSYKVIDDMLDPGIVVHGVAIKPGKPVVLAAHDGKPVVVLPGFPTSCIVTFNVFVVPLLRMMGGLSDDDLSRVKGRCAVRHHSDAGKHEFVLSNVISDAQGGYLVYPITKSSGAVTSFALADGYFEVPIGVDYIDCDERIDVVLLSLQSVSDIVFIGSQCMGSDALLGMVPGRVKVINVGSSGGLRACMRGEADVAGMHLLKDGVYNVPFMEEGLVLVRGYRRKQGIMFRRGGSFKSPDDFLGDPDLVFVNRNGGSGTRILFDEMIGDADVSLIKGYDNEAKSHNAVACAVASGKADWGVGIYSAAKMYGLEFIDIRDEEYDFCIPQGKLLKKGVKEFMGLLKSPEFKKKLVGMDGFVVPPDIGEIVYGG